jgi:hypothetical protein
MKTVLSQRMYHSRNWSPVHHMLHGYSKKEEAVSYDRPGNQNLTSSGGHVNPERKGCACM